MVLPKVARERGNEPNFIPIGNENPFLRQHQNRYDNPAQVIPLSHLPPEQRNVNGNVLQALPRVDTEGELEYQDPLQSLPNDVQELLSKHRDQQITVDGDKVIINGHIVKPDLPGNKLEYFIYNVIGLMFIVYTVFMLTNWHYSWIY